MSLLDIIKNLFASSPATKASSDIPEDSMLRRHYLTHLKSLAEQKK